MHWIALQPPHEAARQAWGWRALQFTPRVAHAGPALLVEISASERLFGGRRALLHKLFEGMGHQEGLPEIIWARGPTSLLAQAFLSLRLGGKPVPQRWPDGLPLESLEAALPHAATLERTGCRTWGQLRALPRDGVARRFGAGLLSALDTAYGEKPESYPWITLPEVFDVKVELPALATTAPELMWTANRLLGQMALWLQARHHGAVALELEWTLDLKRHDGVQLPSHEQAEVRTSQPTQDMAHLRRLVSEHLERTVLRAPANHLRLRTLETLPWAGESRGFLPEDNRKGDKLHHFIERVSARLGAHNVIVPVPRSDHRPERMQSWHAANGEARRPGEDVRPDSLYPPWLLPEPLRLEVKDNKPQYGGPLQRLARAWRVETAWWEDGTPARRDYYIARSEGAGLVWIYRELTSGDEAEELQEHRWYLQGLYA
ncbi:MAG: DNA polymerase Y family protein [Burkholderiaceae bacterium]